MFTYFKSTWLRKINIYFNVNDMLPATIRFRNKLIQLNALKINILNTMIYVTLQINVITIKRINC